MVLLRHGELIDLRLAVPEQPEGVMLAQILQPAEPALVGRNPVPVAVAEILELAPLQADVEQPDGSLSSPFSAR